MNSSQTTCLIKTCRSRQQDWNLSENSGQQSIRDFPKSSLCGIKFQGFSTNHTYHLLVSDIFLPKGNNRLQDRAVSWTAQGALTHEIGISHKDGRQRIPFRKLAGCESLGILLAVATHLARLAHMFGFLRNHLWLFPDQVALETRRRLLLRRITSK